MKRREYNRIFAILYASIYLVVAVFSQSLHHHGSGLYFKEFHFIKYEKSITNAIEFSDYGNCLSCHSFHEGNFLIPNKMDINFLKFDIFKESAFVFKFPSLQLSITAFYLRGPPQNFI